MSAVTKILSADQLHELWGAGFTIVRRGVDPFEIDAKLIPRGMAYQWNPIDLRRPPSQERADGWTVVPYSRHEGVFAPWGTPGVIQCGGLELCEKPTAEVVAYHGRAHAKARQNVDDWLAKTGADFSGAVKVGGETKIVGDKDLAQQVGDISISEDGEMAQVGATKTIETIVAIPKDMSPHILAIFKERDRLEAEVVRKDRTLAPGPIADKFYAALEADKSAPWWPTLRAILLPIACDNVRANLEKGKTDE